MNKSQNLVKFSPYRSLYYRECPRETPLIKIKRSQQVSTYLAVVLFYHSYHFNITHLLQVTSHINCFHEAQSSVHLTVLNPILGLKQGDNLTNDQELGNKTL